MCIEVQITYLSIPNKHLLQVKLLILVLTESDSYPVYKIVILIIAFVGVPVALLTLRSIINKADAGRQSNAKVEVKIRGGLRQEESGAGNRGVPRSYIISMFDPKFKNALRDFFAEALKKLEFHNLEHFQAVASWYGGND